MGTLRLQVLQGTDLYDGLNAEKVLLEQSPALFNFVFVRVSLLDSSDQLIMAYSSNALPYSGGSVDFNEEEFLFENVSQTSSLQVAILASKGTGKKSINVCGGEVRIPMSRLEENIPVLQWYQLSQGQPTSKSIKTSLKFEVCFFFDSRVCILETRDTINRSGRLEISVDDGDLGIGSGEYEGSDHCPVFPSASDVGSFPSSVVTSPDQDRIQSSLKLRSLESGDSLPPNDPEDRPNLGAAKSRNIDSISPTQFVQIDPIVLSTAESTIAHSHSEDVIAHDLPPSLPTGIVDYCLIIGPASIPRDNTEGCCLSQISRNSSSSSKANLTRNSEQELLFSIHPDDSHEDRSEDQSESNDEVNDLESTELPEETIFSSVCVWDKYPLVGHAGSRHMPDKMEWFVFPDGPKIITASERPSVESNYFVLNSGEETQWYGVGITFFIRGFSVDVQESQINQRNEEEFTPFMWGNMSKEKINLPGDENATSWVWIGVCFCLLTRAPYVDALMVTLRHIYSIHIEPLLIHSETDSCGFPTQPLSLNLDNFMSMLCLEAISPVPGVLDVALRLPGRSIPDSTVIFNGNSLQSWPYCPHELKVALQIVGVRTMMDLVYYAMAERKIILYSSDTSRLSIVCESLRVLIYPLNWCSAYIPVVPALLLDLVEAPVPYILGISSQLLNKINSSILQSVVLVNCDTGLMTTTIPIQRYPESIDRWCMVALKSIASEKWVPDSNCGIYVSPNNAIQMIVLDCFLSVFSWLPECIFNVGAGYPIFNSHRFLHGYCPANAVGLAESVIDSQSFQRLVSEIHLPRLSLFVNCCKRMKYGYGYSRFIDGVSNSSTEMYPLEDRRFGMDLEENLPLGELSNPRRLLRPPYDLTNTNLPISQPIIPEWISESNILNSRAIQAVIERYNFTLLSDIREKIRLSIEPESSFDDSLPSSVVKNSRDVAFPPITFSPRSNKNVIDAKKRRKTWNFDQGLEQLLVTPISDSISENLESKVHSLRLKYRNHVVMQHKLTRDLIKVSKRLHAEYMFGEDVVMRLILRILPLSSSDGIHDMDLATALQQGSDSFSQGAARRSLVIVLSEYCDQMSIRSSHSKSYQTSHLHDLEPKFCHEKCPVELHVTAFGYATRLCKLLLQACTVHKDYLTAHGLLDICGYFYHVMFDENSPNSKLCYIQSLRSRINQHPIYQNQTLWRTVINDAISTHNTRNKKKKRDVPLLVTLRPILIHMCGSDLVMEKMEDIIAGVVRDFSIEVAEQEDILEALKKIWTISKRYRSDKGCNLEDPEEQKGIRLALHGGTPTRKQPLSPWHQSFLPLSEKQKVDIGEDEVESSVNPTPETISQSGSLLDEQISALHLAPSRLPIDRVVRDIDSSSGYLDMFSRNVMFTPLPLEGNIIHEHCVTALDVSNIWSASGDSNGNVSVIDMETGTTVMQHKHNASITGIKFLPCGLIASTCSAGVLKISRGPGWHATDSSFKSWTKMYRKSVLAVHRPFSAAVTSLALALPYNYRGKSFPANVNMKWGQKEEDWDTVPPGVLESKWFLAVGGASGGVKIYQGSSISSSGAGGSEIMSASAPDRGSISCLNIVSSTLQISSLQSSVNLCSNPSDQSEHRDVSVLVSPTRTNSLWSPSQAPDVNLPGSLFIGTSKGSVVVYDLETKRSLFKSSNEERHRGFVSGIIPVRTHELLSGGFDRLVKLWDIRSYSSDCVELTGSNAAITSLAVDDYNDHKVIASCADGFIRIWDTRYPTQGRPYLVLEGHTDRITCMAQKSGILVSGSYDGSLRSWSLSTGSCLQKLRTDMKSPVSCLALEAKSTILNSQDFVSINMDQSTTSRKEESDHPTLMSLKNIWIASGGWEGSVRVWTGREV